MQYGEENLKCHKTLKERERQGKETNQWSLKEALLTKYENVRTNSE